MKKPHPAWLKKSVIQNDNVSRIESYLRGHRLNTVCKSARCPNIFECFSNGRATFMILGNACTRSCGFCSVESGRLSAPDADEPARVASMVRALDMRYVVVTSVTRDDLKDGGAGHFADTVRKIRAVSPGVRIEVLVPDFKGDASAVEIVLGSSPDVFGHNIETVPRLYGKVRRGADYRRSLAVLSAANKKSGRMITKSGIMLGLGERKEEVRGSLEDLAGAGVAAVVIGQYLRPDAGCLEVSEYIHPDVFKEYEGLAKRIGFIYVSSEPFARSSYKANDITVISRQQSAAKI